MLTPFSHTSNPSPLPKLSSCHPSPLTSPPPQRRKKKKTKEEETGFRRHFIKKLCN